jgi:hypothetical protein
VNAPDPRRIELIRKLLDLSVNNSNAAERALAAERAAELMRKYDLRMSDIFPSAAPPRPETPPPPPPPPNPPRPQSTPPPPPSSMMPPLTSGWLACLNFGFFYGMLILLCAGFTVGTEASGSVIISVAVLVMGCLAYQQLIGNLSLPALWKNLWRNHRRASVAAIVFLGGLFIGLVERKPPVPAGTALLNPPGSPEGMRFTRHRFCKGKSSYGLPNDCHTYILAQGGITQESPANLEGLIGQMRAEGTSLAGIPVFLDSPGGRVRAGVELGRLIRRYGLTTYVGGPYDEDTSGPEPVRLVDHGECLSACVWVFAGGVTRTYREPGVIGVHQFYGVEKEHAESEAQTTMVYLGQYLEQMGVDRKLLDLGATVPSSEMRTVTLAQAQGWRLDNFEELAPTAPIAGPAPSQVEPPPATTPAPQSPPAPEIVPPPVPAPPVAATTPQACEQAGTQLWAKERIRLFTFPIQRDYYLSYLDQQGRCYARGFLTSHSDLAWFQKFDILYDGSTGDPIAWAEVKREGGYWAWIDGDSELGDAASGILAYEKAMAFMRDREFQKLRSGSLRLIPAVESQTP